MREKKEVHEGAWFAKSAQGTRAISGGSSLSRITRERAIARPHLRVHRALAPSTPAEAADLATPVNLNDSGATVHEARVGNSRGASGCVGSALCGGRCTAEFCRMPENQDVCMARPRMRLADLPRPTHSRGVTPQGLPAVSRRGETQRMHAAPRDRWRPGGLGGTMETHTDSRGAHNTDGVGGYVVFPHRAAHRRRPRARTRRRRGRT